MSDIVFRQVTAEFLADPSTDGVLSAKKEVTFDTNVIEAAAAIQSFKVSFGNDEDHDVMTVGAEINNIKTIANVVEFTASVQLVDRSENTLKRTDSSMTVLVIAKVE